MINLLRDANVKCSITWNKHPELSIIINDRYKHDFPASSKESRMLLVMDINSIEVLFNKGTYFIYNETLVDYRLADYKGFIHNDNAINKLQDIVGIEEQNNNSVFSRIKTNNGINLGGVWDKFDLVIPELSTGGEFENTLNYKWSPFSPNITTSIDIERLVCANGMVATSPVVTFDVPIINGWESNLNVVATQLKPRFRGILSERLISMTETRASVADVMFANEVLSKRIMEESFKDMDNTSNLVKLSAMTDVKSYLSEYYTDEVFKDKKKAKLVNSHLNQFTVFNILTESMTHYGNDNAKNDNEIQMYLNRTLFDKMEKRSNSETVKFDHINNDHRTAFFAENE